MATSKTDQLIYPYTDEAGFTWIDRSGMLTEEKYPCFMCKRPTTRVDIDFHGYFCNSYACNLQIDQELKNDNPVQ